MLSFSYIYTFRTRMLSRSLTLTVPGEYSHTQTSQGCDMQTHLSAVFKNFFSDWLILLPAPAVNRRATSAVACQS